MTDDRPDRSAVSDELGVPESPPDPETADHVLSEAELCYPTFDFESGEVSIEGGFDLERDLDADGMRTWLDDLSGAIASHDVAVEGADRRITFGVAPADVRLSFDPDPDHRGRLSVTFTFDAKAMTSESADVDPVGARGGRGFVPRAMLASDRDPDSFRCYNWIDDPTWGGRGDSNPSERETDTNGPPE